MTRPLLVHKRQSRRKKQLNAHLDLRFPSRISLGRIEHIDPSVKRRSDDVLSTPIE